MTPEQITETLATKRLRLSTKNLWYHYSAPILFSIVTLPFTWMIIQTLFTDKFKHVPSSVYWTISLLPAMTIATFINQYTILKCKEIRTPFDKTKNQELIISALSSLEWHIKKTQVNFIEAVNPFSDLRTWGDEIISIIIDDNRVLVNSRCNPDYGRLPQAGLSFGKNKQNIRKFADTFELLSQYPDKIPMTNFEM